VKTLGRQCTGASDTSAGNNFRSAMYSSLMYSLSMEDLNAYKRAVELNPETHHKTIMTNIAKKMTKEIISCQQRCAKMGDKYSSAAYIHLVDQALSVTMKRCLSFLYTNDDASRDRLSTVAYAHALKAFANLTDTSRNTFCYVSGDDSIGGSQLEPSQLLPSMQALSLMLGQKYETSTLPNGKQVGQQPTLHGREFCSAFLVENDNEYALVKNVQKATMKLTASLYSCTAQAAREELVIKIISALQQNKTGLFYETCHELLRLPALVLVRSQLFNSGASAKQRKKLERLIAEVVKGVEPERRASLTEEIRMGALKLEYTPTPESLLLLEAGLYCDANVAFVRAIHDLHTMDSLLV